MGQSALRRCRLHLPSGPIPSRPVLFRPVRFRPVSFRSVQWFRLPKPGFRRGFSGDARPFPDGGVVLVPDELGSQHLIDHPGAAGKIGFRAAAHKAHGGQHCLAHLLVRQQLQHFQLVIEQGNVFFLAIMNHLLHSPGKPPSVARLRTTAHEKCRITRPTPLRLPGTTGRGSA